MRITSFNIDKSYGKDAPWTIRAYWSDDNGNSGACNLPQEAVDHIIAACTEHVNAALPGIGAAIAKSAMPQLTHNIPEAEIV